MMRKFLIFILVILGGVGIFLFLSKQPFQPLKSSLTEKNSSMTEASPILKDITTPAATILMADWVKWPVI